MMKIGVIGLGRLGLPFAVLFAKHYKVYGVDINEQRIRQILSREPFFEPTLNEYPRKYGHNLTVSPNYEVLRRACMHDCWNFEDVLKLSEQLTREYDLGDLLILKSGHTLSHHFGIGAYKNS